MFKFNAKFDADSLLYSLTHFEYNDHIVYIVHTLTQWHLPPPLSSTVKSSLFTHAHSSPLSLAARLHLCCSNHSHCISNSWIFSGQTSHVETYICIHLYFMYIYVWMHINVNTNIHINACWLHINTYLIMYRFICISVMMLLGFTETYFCQNKNNRNRVICSQIIINSITDLVLLSDFLDTRIWGIYTHIMTEFHNVKRNNMKCKGPLINSYQYSDCVFQN